MRSFAIRFYSSSGFSGSPDEQTAALYNESVHVGHGRILALDLGARRIGIAITDEMGWTAQGLPNLERRNIRRDLDALDLLIQEWGVRLVVLGNPLHMSGDESAGSRHALRFAELLRERTGVPVEL